MKHARRRTRAPLIRTFTGLLHALPGLLGILLVVSCGPAGGTLAPPAATRVPTATPFPIGGTPVTDHSIVSIHMFDALRGWAISQTRVLRTVDGGSTWHDLSPAGVGSLGYAASSFFLDDLHAWVLVRGTGDPQHGILCRSVDGGETWSESPVPFGGGTLQFLDTKQGWMMAALGAGAGSMAVAVFQTNDSGQTWTKTFTNDPTQPGAGDSLPLGGLKSGMSAITMQAAWIGGVTYAPGTLYLFQTSDGGRTWTKSAVATPPGYSEAQLETPGPFFLDSRTGYLPVHITSQYGVLLGMYGTHDGGTTWQLSPAYIPMGGASDFISGTTAFVWNGTDFYYTDDSAQTWTTIQPDIAFSAAFAGMDFVSPEVGFVLWDDGAGGHRLYKTADGAHTWIRLP